MSLINVTNVEILDNPTKFTNPFQFEITFECLPPGVQEELEWKLVYVGSAEDEKYDQELDSVLVGPVVVGKNKFVFQAPAPDHALIPSSDVMEVTVLLLTASYKDREFIRVGYYVNNDYAAEEVELHAARAAWSQEVATLQANHLAALEAVRAQQESMQAAADAAIAASAAQSGMAPAESEPISLPEPPAPVLPKPPAVDISRLMRNILADKPRVTRFQIPWDQAQEVQEFVMDAADAASAAEQARSEPSPDAGDATFAAQTAGGVAGEEEEDDEEDDEMEDEMEEEEGEEEDEAADNEEEATMAPVAGPQRMSVE